MTAALRGQTAEEFCATVRARVAEVFARRLGSRLRGLSVFGSVAFGGPIWDGSDIDLVVTLHRRDRPMSALCGEIALAARETEQLVGLPASITVGTVDEVALLWSETVRRALSDNTVTLLGEPLSAQLASRRGWDWREIRRGALRLLCFTRRHIVDQYLTTPGAGDDTDHDPGGRVLKSCVNAARFAVWSATEPGDRLVSHPADVLPRFTKLFDGSGFATIPEVALRHLLAARKPEPELVAECVDFADELLAACRRRSADLFRGGDVFIDPV